VGGMWSILQCCKNTMLSYSSGAETFPSEGLLVSHVNAIAAVFIKDKMQST